MRHAAFVIVLAILLAIVLRRASEDVSVHLVADENGNEALVVSGVISNDPMLFMIDTGYAGPPVLSISYMAQGGVASGTIAQRYAAAAKNLRTTSTGEKNAAVNAFLRKNACRTYTSGCTMNLMGIGITRQSHGDMLLCNSLRLSDHPTFSSDVFVTNMLPLSVHILTMDFLLHRAPCVLMPRKGWMRFGVWDPVLRASFAFQTPKFVGGAMMVVMQVDGHPEPLRIIVDTGAAAPLSISNRTAAENIARARERTQPLKTYQHGVNGEKICCDVYNSDVRIGPHVVRGVQVFLNSTTSNSESDGYAGIGLLRAFDLWISRNEIGFRASGLPPRTSAVSQGSCGE